MEPDLEGLRRLAPVLQHSERGRTACQLALAAEKPELAKEILSQPEEPDGIALAERLLAQGCPCPSSAR